jgi:hypothetical protein
LWTVISNLTDAKEPGITRRPVYRKIVQTAAGPRNVDPSGEQTAMQIGDREVKIPEVD